MDTQEQLEAQLTTLHTFFDALRIVNPLTHEIVLHRHKNTQSCVPTHPCYQIWQRGKVCENCVSMQAFRTQKTAEKLEYVEGQIFLVLATPIEVNGKQYVIEALRNVSDASMINQVAKQTRNEIQSEIEALNEQVIKDQLTGCYSRMYLQNRLPILLMQKKMDHLGDDFLAVGVFDLDDFKIVNDTYGHVVGDRVLQAVGEQLQEIAE